MRKWLLPSHIQRRLLNYRSMARRIQGPPCVLAWVVMITSLGCGTGTTDRAEVEKRVWENEQKVAKAIQTNDLETVRAFLSPDASLVGPAGRVAPIPSLQEQMAQCSISGDFTLDDPSFQWLDDANVILMYTTASKGECTDPATPSRSITINHRGGVSSVWSNRGGKWLSVFHQESQVPADEPAQ